MPWLSRSVALLLVAGCGGSPGVTEATCPTSADGCNKLVGTIGGESLVVTHACPSVGAWVQTVWLTNYMTDSSCTPTAAAQPNNHALDLRFEGTVPPTFNTGFWYPTGPSGGARTEATSGTGVMDVWDAAGRMRGSFDLHFGGDHVCGCFDAVAP